jgi:hypothetical protein
MAGMCGCYVLLLGEPEMNGKGPKLQRPTFGLEIIPFCTLKALG